MLVKLQIKDFAIIRKTEFSLEKGMTVITGETGAGKSILIDALLFVLGARLDKKFLVKDSSTEVIADFDIENNLDAKKILENLCIDTDYESISIRRVVNKSGVSKFFINGVVITSANLKILSPTLINIYSQNTHQSILDNDLQLEIIDNYANCQEQVHGIQNIYKKRKEVQKNIDELEAKAQETATKKELLQYKLEELLELNLVQGDVEELDKQQCQISDLESKMFDLNKIQDILYNNEHSFISCLGELENSFNNYEDDNLNNIRKLISQTKIYMQECYDESLKQLDLLEQDPEQALFIENRLAEIYNIARKYRIEPNLLFEHIQELQSELDSLSTVSEGLTKFKVEKDKLDAEYNQLAQTISRIRIKASKNFEKIAQRSIRKLNMPKCVFRVDISQTKDSATGIDKCEFIANINTDRDLYPLAKVASGGEISRIALAIQSLSSTDKYNTTLVFDEVDAGISGATAEIVGGLLKDLSNRLQIVCITHQAQVAAQADLHFIIDKKYSKDSTISTIQELDYNGRIRALSQIIGGVDITQSTLQHAQEMLQKNLKKPKDSRAFLKVID